MVLEQDLVRHLVEAAVTVELETPDMTLNIGPAAPLDPRGSPARRPGGWRADHQRAAGHRIHASWLREDLRGPHLSPDNGPDQSDRLGLRLRQRDPLHRRRRTPHGTRGARTGPVHPADPDRDGPDLLTPGLQCLLSTRAGRRHPVVLRPARPRAGARPSRVGDRRALPSQFQPDRRGQAGRRVGFGHSQDDPGPAQDIPARDPRCDGQGAGHL